MLIVYRTLNKLKQQRGIADSDFPICWAWPYHVEVYGTMAKMPPTSKVPAQ